MKRRTGSWNLPAKSGLLRRVAGGSVLLAGLALAPAAARADATWSGGSAVNDDWSRGLNWVGNVAPLPAAGQQLTFDGNVRLTPEQDRETYELNRILFAPTAGAFRIHGNEIKFSGNGAGITFNKAAVANNTNNQSLANPLRLNASIEIGGDAPANKTLTLSGKISAADATHGIVKTGPYKLVLRTGDGFDAANTYTGLTSIRNGTVELDGASGVDAIAGNIQVGDTVNACHLRLANGNKIADTATLLIAINSEFHLNGFNEEIKYLKGAGVVDTGESSSWFRTDGAGAAADAVWNGNIRGKGNLVKVGDGTLVLTQTNEYTGKTQVDAGILKVNGQIGRPGVDIVNNRRISQRCDQVTVNAGGKLQGGGTIYSTKKVINKSGAKIEPKFASPGRLIIDGLIDPDEDEPREVGGVLMEPGSALGIEIDGLFPGNGPGYHSQLVVLGEVLLDEPYFELELASPPMPGHGYVVLDNDGVDPIDGRFAGIFQGGIVSATYAGQTWDFIADYYGGDGNDFMLTCVPEPASVGLLSLGALVALRRRAR